MNGKEPLDIDLGDAADRRGRGRYRLYPARNRADRGARGPWPPQRRWARHAAASGGAGLRALVRRAPRGDARALRALVAASREPHDALIGLTGCIGMGKSAAAAHFARYGMPVFDADAGVHRLYEGDAVPADRGGVSRRRRARARSTAMRCRPQLLADPGASPSSRKSCIRWCAPAEIAFLQREEKKRRAQLAVLEIPLLFETGADERVDVTIVLSAPRQVQRAARAGAARHDGGEARASARAPAARCREATRAPTSLWTAARACADMHAEIDKLIELLRGRKAAS